MTFGLILDSAATTAYGAFLALLNVVQTVALTYIAARWGSEKRPHLERASVASLQSELDERAHRGNSGVVDDHGEGITRRNLH